MTAVACLPDWHGGCLCGYPEASSLSKDGTMQMRECLLFPAGEARPTTGPGLPWLGALVRCDTRLRSGYEGAATLDPANKSLID